NLEIEEYTKNPLKNPHTILKEQATLISQMTKGLILGEVVSGDYQVDIRETPFVTPIEKELVATNLPTLKIGQYVIKKPDNDKNRHQKMSKIFRLKVPSLNNYTYSLLQIIYPITSFYPIFIYSFVSDNHPTKSCSDEQEFLSALENILSSEKVHQVIKALFSQID
ncbi:MAG: hypothetical protein AB4058_03745, partial [Microcystaceae cyanobacterium]